MKLTNMLLGGAIGDALGVPVEFKSRISLDNEPVVDMREFGTHSQEKGTWSDDTSLTMCTADVLSEHGYDLENIAISFINWKDANLWTARGKVFDVGGTTEQAICNISKYHKRFDEKIITGLTYEESNGNGSLMRILPIIYILRDIDDIDKRYEIVAELSSLTHGHLKSIISCFILCEFALRLYKGEEKFDAFQNCVIEITQFLVDKDIPANSYTCFNRIWEFSLTSLERNKIYSSGYVVSTLEASVWSFLTTDNFKDAVLTAINLGEDTDTIGSITGQLAGLYYGVDCQEWLDVLARKEDIIEIGNKLDNII